MNTTQAMSINCKGTLVDLSKPKIMGILNLTPDSFFDGGKYNNEDAALKQCEKMISEGADFVDVGTYSSKPGANEISEDEELNRLLPTLERILKEFPETFFSIDTFRSTVALKALDRGAALINDISAGNLDPKMLETVGKYKVPFIAMHMQGTPSNMQDDPRYTNANAEILRWLSLRSKVLQEQGIRQLVVDPGFGFGKTVEHNYQLLKSLDTFKSIELPVLAGVSRKSMIWKTLSNSPEESLNGTTALHAWALSGGAHILRVHDVKEALETVLLFNAMQSS